MEAIHSDPGVLFTRIEGSGSPWGLELYTGSEDHSDLNYKKMGVVIGSGVDHRSHLSVCPVEASAGVKADAANQREEVD